MSHTPGPWHTPLDTQYGQWVRAGDGSLIARIHQRGATVEMAEDDPHRSTGLDARQPETEANAHLIESAPDLLAAASRMVGVGYVGHRCAGANCSHCDAMDSLRAAIAKARGNQ